MSYFREGENNHMDDKKRGYSLPIREWIFIRPAQDLQVYRSSFQQASHAHLPQSTHWRSPQYRVGRAAEIALVLREGAGIFCRGFPCFRITLISLFSSRNRSGESLLFGTAFCGKFFFQSVKSCLQRSKRSLHPGLIILQFGKACLVLIKDTCVLFRELPEFRRKTSCHSSTILWNRRSRYSSTRLSTGRASEMFPFAPGRNNTPGIR